MTKINKVFNIRIISLLVAAVFLLTSTAYPYAERNSLRVPLGDYKRELSGMKSSQAASTDVPIDISLLKDFKEFIFPKGTLYGSRWDWVNGAPYGAPYHENYVHGGIDIRLYRTSSGEGEKERKIPKGTPIISLVDGIVINESEVVVLGEREDYLVIKTDDNKVVVYNHIMPALNFGAAVKKGDVIGAFRNSPYDWMPSHLHLEVKQLEGDATLPSRENYASAKDYNRTLTESISPGKLTPGKVDPLKLWPFIRNISAIDPDDTASGSSLAQAQMTKPASPGLPIAIRGAL